MKKAMGYLILGIFVIICIDNHVAIAQPAPIENSHASAFTLQAEGLNNEMITLNDFEGKFIIVDLWAPWSPTCKHHSNTLKALAKRFEKKGENAVILKYALESDRDRWVSTVSTHPIEGNVVQARDPLGHASPIVSQLGIVGPPYLLVFSPEGDLLYRGPKIDDAYRSLRKAMKRYH